MKVIVPDAMRERAAGYAALNMRPLRIVAELADPVAYYHPVHFDGILSSAVVEDVTGGAGVPPSSDWYYIPLPLRVVWRTQDGVPLWASTDMEPVGQYENEIIYWHRRAPEPYMTWRNIITTSGRHKEKRTPLPCIVANEMACHVIGNANEIARLLERVTAIGKKRHSLGAVRRWLISPIDEFSFVRDGVFLRPVPAGMFGGVDIDAMGTLRLEAFTPPYWHVMSRAMCIPAGAEKGELNA